MNVNLDVLELIFGHLRGSDLVNAALVSRAFLAGAIPSLYATIEYTHRHVKRALSPFATIAAHDHLGVHVKRIALHAAPLFQPVSTIIHPAFLHDLSRALDTTTNLRAFVCTPKILPPLLQHLVDKPRLTHLRICAPLGSRQVPLLQHRTGLQHLCLDFPSWTVVDVLPKWTASMQKTLAHLTLFMSQDTDAAILSTTLAQLPRLRGLHVIGCPRITHAIILKALSHTPELRELSLTIFPSQEDAIPPLNFTIPPITHLSIDIRASYPGLKSLLARIISRISPRDALAICGGWIGEIKGSSEHTDPPPNDAENDHGGPPGAGTGPFGQNFHVVQGHVHIPMPGGQGHGINQPNDPPLLSPPAPHGNTQPNPNPPAPPPNPGNPPPAVFGFHFPFPLGNHDGNNNNPPGGGPPNLPNPNANPDLDAPSLIDSFPPTLSTLHLPQITPTGLREVLGRCEGIQLLGIVIGSAFATYGSAKPTKPDGRSPARFKGHSVNTLIRPEVSALSDILARARTLRELIIDTTPIDFANHNTGTGSGSARSHRSPGGYTLLTPTAVRMLMRESPLLRRIVAEGRVWESTTPIPSSPLPFPRCLDIELTLYPALRGAGAGYNHAHGPPGFGTHGGGYGQTDAGNSHWFWLTDLASEGKTRDY